MTTSNYGYTKQVKLSFEDAIARVKEELQKEGFGILTEIDIRATLKKKLDVDFKKYMILGACNPPNAYKALQLEQEIGLMLPCNVIVYEEDDFVYVSAILPSIAMGMIENPGLKDVAREIEERLKLAMDALVR